MDVELAQALAENELLKSLLYCTKRSCNNCGKITCENFQRQRKDCCENWVSYKDYITELEQQIEKMKRCEICKEYTSGSCNYHSYSQQVCKENGMKLFKLKEIKENDR